MNKNVTVQATINAPVAIVWEFYTSPEHIMNWNNASEDWITSKSENDLRVGGQFMSRMESKDGSEGFDFTGVYDEVIENSSIKYTMSDGREVVVRMTEEGDQTKIAVTFDLENENSTELQRDGWQAILDSFQRYVESN